MPVCAATASASNRHKWWEMDLSFGVVWCLEKVGLATDVIRPRHLRHATRRGKASAE